MAVSRYDVIVSPGLNTWVVKELPAPIRPPTIMATIATGMPMAKASMMLAATRFQKPA